MGPSAYAWLLFIESMPAGVDLILRRVVVIGGPDVSDEAKVIRMFGKVGPPIGDLDATLAMFLPPDLHRIDGGINIADIDLLGRH